MNLKGVFSIERVVTLLTPFFAATAATFTAWAGRHAGVHLDAHSVAGVEGFAFLGSVGIVAKWLHGRQIPAIAQLGLSPAEFAVLGEEIKTYLSQHAPEVKADEQAIVEAVLKRIAGGLSGPVAATPGTPAASPPQP